MRVKQVEGVWLLMDGREIIESYDTKYEALQALFDATRSLDLGQNQET